MSNQIIAVMSKKAEKHILAPGAWMGAVFIVLISLAFSSLYFFNTFPISEGWNVNYAELFLRGKIPYRDFYYYLPPLSLFLDVLLWKLSFGFLIIYRFWYLVQRIVIYLLLYRLLCRYFSWKYAAISCAIAEVLCTAEVYDLFGDYNQTVSFLGILLAYAAVNFAESEDTRQKLQNLFLAGVVLGLMFLCKQTIVLAAFIVYFAALIVYCSINRDKNFIRYIFAAAAGALLPVGCVFVWLAANNALYPFIHQVFLSVGGKGSILRIVAEGISLALLHADLWVLALLVFGMIRLRQQSALDSRHLKAILSVMALVASLLLLVKFKLVNYFDALTANKLTVVFFVVGMFPAIAVFLFGKRLKHYKLWVKGVFVFWSVLFLGGVLSSKEVLSAIVEKGLFTLIETVFGTVVFYLQILLLVHFVVQRVKIGPSAKGFEGLAMLSCAGISVAYASTMAAAGGVFAPHSMILVTPLLLSFIFSHLSKDAVLRAFKYILYGVCMVLITITCAQKALASYAWWGAEAAPIWEKVYSTDVPALKGFTFSKAEQEMYETITALVEENSDEDDLVFGYPYIKIFNILCNRYESTFVPVLWYDVVGDDYVEETLYEVQQNMPDIVIWKDIPGSLQAHEEAYRNGEPLVQRKLEQFFKEVFSTKYQLLGDVNGVQVYKLIEEQTGKIEQQMMDGNTAIQWIEEFNIRLETEQ